MNRIISIFLIFILISLKIIAQNFSDVLYVNPNYQPAKNLNRVMTLTQETIKEVVIIAMDPGSGCILPSWFDALFSEHLPTYFSESTHGNFIYQPTVLKRDATHAFEMLTIPSPHSHGFNNMQYVLQTADATVNFALYDWNNDGIVELHFTSIGPGNWGVAYIGGGYSYEYTTNDQGSNGLIRVRVNHESRGINRDNYYGVIVHEDGHFYFGFNDQEHSGLTTFNHWGLGSFDVMSHVLGFYDDQRVFTQPSPYNPTYSAVKGWISPTNITSDLTNFTLQDYQFSKALYLYTPPSLPSNAVPNQKFYISYIVPNRSYVFKNFPTIDKDKGAVLIWHTKGDGLINNSDFTNWYSKDIDVEAAHGKTNWTDDQYDTGVQNPISGRDKLEVRKVVNNQIVGGPYYGQVEVGESNIFYLPGDGKRFAFYSNPNSNLYNQYESYFHNISSGLVFKNFQYISNIAKADIQINNCAVDVNTTLPIGNWYFDHDIIVNSGVTLTIQGGTTLKFAYDKKIIVNGTLNAVGNSNSRITFTRSGTSGTWGGIQFNSGSSGNIQYCTIQNATNGIFFNNTGSSSIQVSNCIIQNNLYNGLSLYNSSPLITNNLIIYNGTNGIYCNSYSSPKINYNTLKWNSQSGLYCSSYSSPTAALYYYGPGNNVIRDNYGYGIFAQYNCIPSFGNPGGGGNNSIFLNTSYEVCAYYGCTVYAQYNYWGTGSTISAYQSTIYNENPLPNDPNPGRSVIPTSENSDIGTVNLSLNYSESTHENPNYAESEILDDGEINKYKDIFLKERNTDRGRYALIMLEDSYWKMKKDGFVDFINKEILSRKNVKDELTVMAYELINRSYIENGKYNQAVSNFEKIQKELLLNKEIEKNTLFSLGALYLNCLDDKIKASDYFNELKTKFPGDRLVFDVDMILGDLNSRNNNMASNNNLSEKSINKISDSYELKECYPNPFNPTTTIRYRIAKDGFISLRVYDMLGREVAELVNEDKKAGDYMVHFDGSKLSSGVYIYKLVGSSVNISKKMILMK